MLFGNHYFFHNFFTVFMGPEGPEGPVFSQHFQFLLFAERSVKRLIYLSL